MLPMQELNNIIFENSLKVYIFYTLDGTQKNNLSVRRTASTKLIFYLMNAICRCIFLGRRLTFSMFHLWILIMCTVCYIW